ncbi:MAG: CDP-alcohol phosphatidyltransferase family protein [Chloroflexi bacterium]|nr:CDP-alcohol phosphatidyltransferase family protein [Chloroflexota bacterium]
MATFRGTLQQQTRRTAERLVAPFARTGITPNGLTVAGFALSVVAGLVLASGALVAGGLMVLLAGAFDMFDGALARVTDRKTTFGAFFDSTLDRYSEAVIFLGLQVAFLRAVEHDWMPWAGVILCYTIAIGSLMISYTRARAEGLNLDCEIGWLQRPERVIALGVGLLLPQLLLLAVLVALAIFTQITVIQRIAHVRRLTQGR